jgi:anti-sigma factor RsiW
MNCNEVHAKLADLLFGNEELATAQMIAGDNAAEGVAGRDAFADGFQTHLDGCEACRTQLAEMRATISLMDAWEAPEPNPYFLTRLNARLDEEREAAPVGWPMSWIEKLRARLVYGSRIGLRPVAAMSLTLMVLIGGGAYLGLSNSLDTQTAQQPAAVVHDLQTLDTNAQLLDQLESLSSQNND